MRQHGFVLVGLMIAVVIAIVVAGGYFYVSHHQSNTELSTTSAPSNTDRDSTPSRYQDSQDLDSATAELDSTDIDADLDASLKDLDSDSADF